LTAATTIVAIGVSSSLKATTHLLLSPNGTVGIANGAGCKAKSILANALVQATPHNVNSSIVEHLDLETLKTKFPVCCMF
jgi:hypothetical protein